MELKDIAQKYPDIAKRVESLERNEKAARMLLKVADMPGTKLLISHMEHMIETINSHLLWDVELSELERQGLFRERTCWSWLIGQFDKQHQVLKNIEEFKQKYD